MKNRPKRVKGKFREKEVFLEVGVVILTLSISLLPTGLYPFYLKMSHSW
jgi:hypothetical protein